MSSEARSKGVTARTWFSSVSGLVCCIALTCTSVRAEPVAPLSVKALFANPAYSSLVISDDGQTLAVIGSKEDFQLILTRPVGGGALKPIAKLGEPERRVSWVEWANPTRLLVSVQARNPNAVGMRSRATYLYGVDADGANLLWLGSRWPTYGEDHIPITVQDDIIHWTPNDPKTVLVQIRPPFLGDKTRVMTMNVNTGILKPPVWSEKEIEQWFADTDGNLRAGVAYKTGNTLELWTRIEPKAALELSLRTSSVAPEMSFLGFDDEDPSKIFVLKDLDGRDAVFEFDLRQRKLGALVFAHPEVDIDGLVRSPDGVHVVGVRYTADSPQIHFLDPTAKREHAALLTALEREFGQAVQAQPVSRSQNGKRQILLVSSDTQPPIYFLYDQDLKHLSRLIDERPGVAREQLSATKRVTYAARDGLAIPAYLTLPRAGATKKLPMIALVHGGPMGRDRIEWDPEVQLFASHGFAVLQVNFRGSTGLGAKHREAGYREWGQKIQDDITDGVKWAIAEGIADPDRIGIYGGSFGGYSALVGLSKTPELYRAGAAYAAVTDIERMLSDDKWYDWRANWHEAMIGGERGDAERLRANSPLQRVAKVRVPVMLGHGSDDQRIDVRQSQRMAKALQDADKDVTYLEFPNEIHGFNLESNRIRWYESLIAFFEKNLVAREPALATAERSE